MTRRQEAILYHLKKHWALYREGPTVLELEEVSGYPDTTIQRELRVMEEMGVVERFQRTRGWRPI